MSLIKNTFSIFKRDVLISILKFVTGIFIARKLGLEMLGIWSILLMISNFIEAFGRIKSDAAIIYFVGKKKLNLSEAVVNINFIFVINIFILGILLIINSQNLYELFIKSKLSYSRRF